MKKAKLTGKILGIALVFVLIRAVLRATTLTLANLGNNQISAQEGIFSVAGLAPFFV